MSISATAAAISQILKVASDDGILPIVRVSVKGGGCAGFAYDMVFIEEDKLTAVDERVDSNGVTLVVDPISLQYVEGTSIDYIDTVMMSGFKFNNPKSTGSCGCGNSFSA